MTLLDQLEPDHRALLEGVATELVLDRGAYLIRRGEAGGDFFVVDDGQIEIVDSRTMPETILAVLSPGATFGEVSFVDDSPRSADARARGPTRVRRWTKEDVRGLLRREPALGSRFYECIARVTTGHLRNQTQAAHAGRGRTDGATLAGAERVRADVSAFATTLKAALVQAETALRHDPPTADAPAAVERALDQIQSWITQHFAAYPEPDLAEESTRLLTAELHPYLVRSSLADLCIRRAQGAVGGTEVVTHVLADEARGDGQLGELVDRWLLDRPTFRALRATEARLGPLVVRAIESSVATGAAGSRAGGGAGDAGAGIVEARGASGDGAAAQGVSAQGAGLQGAASEGETSQRAVAQGAGLQGAASEGETSQRAVAESAQEAGAPSQSGRANVAVFNAGAGVVLRAVADAVGDRVTTLFVCDPSRDALGVATSRVADVSGESSTLKVVPVQLNIIDVAVGRWRTELPPQDLIVVHDLLDYLPDRLVVGFLQQMAALLRARGELLIAALGPSSDQTLLDRLIGWPTVRRQPERLVRLAERAGLSATAHEAAGDPLVVISARRAARV